MTYCNSISVSEHVVMMILSLVRNYIPSHDWVVKGGWNIADCVERSYDVEGMQVGTVASGRIGLAVLRRMLCYTALSLSRWSFGCAWFIARSCKSCCGTA